jgi:hypothetical protein
MQTLEQRSWRLQMSVLKYSSWLRDLWRSTLICKSLNLRKHSSQCPNQQYNLPKLLKHRWMNLFKGVLDRFPQHKKGRSIVDLEPAEDVDRKTGHAMELKMSKTVKMCAEIVTAQIVPEETLESTKVERHATMMGTKLLKNNNLYLIM